MKFHDKKERDLFDQIQTADKKIGKKTKFLLPRAKEKITLSYENIIFLAIGFVMSSIIFFSLGVEKGRQDIGYRTEEIREIKAPEERTQDKYVIQLAAFKTKGSAEDERSRLRKKGHTAVLKKSGGHYQLYTGSFNNKKKAQKLLKKLKETYKDCYIKKL